MSFKQLYGGIDKETRKKVPFFDLVYQYINQKWDEINTHKHVKTDIYNRMLLLNNYKTKPIRQIVSYDIDPIARKIGSYFSDKVKFQTMDIKDITFEENSSEELYEAMKEYLECINTKNTQNKFNDIQLKFNNFLHSLELAKSSKIDFLGFL